VRAFEHEEESAMQTRDAGEETLVDAARTPPQAAPRRQSRLRLLAAVIAVVLVVGAAGGVFAELAQREGTRSQQPSWQRTLTGYSVSAVVGAPSNKAVLYACATPWHGASPVVGSASSGGGYTNPSYTVLRSADGGATWRDVGAGTGFAGTCQIAVNPANVDEVYAVSAPRQVTSGGSAASFILHTTNGGAIWSAIHPTTLGALYRRGAIPWSVADLSMAGDRLFGLQWLQSMPQEPPVGPPMPAFAPALARLVASADGGRTWTVIDDQFGAAWLGVRSYAVDPERPATIYILAGRPIGPVEYGGPNGVQLPPSSPQPSGTEADLYKTTNGGASWQPLLRSISYGMTVRLAADSPATVYVGGSPSPVPLVASAGAPGAPSAPVGAAPAGVLGGFGLRVSRDGGATWHDGASLPVRVYAWNWLVAPGGTVYVSVAGVGGAGTGAGGSGTAVPGSPRIVPPAAAGSAGASIHTLPPVVTTQPPTPSSRTNGTPPVSQNIIYRYDPGANAWSQLTAPQAAGALVAATAAANGGTALWFMAEGAPNGVLYRGIV
jgi:hypothetical protein